MASNTGRSKILWIAQTAIFIALLVALQFATRSMGQFVTGSVVNLILIVASLTAGLFSGLAVALLSPFFAFMLGIGPAFLQVVPLVALGNMALVFFVWLIGRKGEEVEGAMAYIWRILGVVAGAVVKFAILYFGIVKLLLPLLDLKPPQVTALSAAFSWPQLVTAAIGGAIAVLVVPPVLKAIRKR